MCVTRINSQPMRLDITNRILLGISVSAAIAYLVVGQWQAFPEHVVAKGLAISALALLAFRSRQPLLGAALALGSLGDILLDLDPKLFVFGLGSFLLGHLTYVALFLRHRHRPVRWTAARTATASALIVYTAAFSVWLAPSLGAFAMPVYAYMGAITAMALSTVAAGYSRPWVVLGAILFLASDSMLGAAKFVGTFPGRDVLVWATYVLGQYGLALGFLAESGYGEGSRREETTQGS